MLDIWHESSYAGEEAGSKPQLNEGGSNMAGEVVLQCQIGKPVMAVASERQVTYLLALVRPGERLRSLRFPFNFALVLDRSFSMRGGQPSGGEGGCGPAGG